MPRFDPSDPYPLLPPGRYTYADEQAHSACVDEWLGLRVPETEARLRAREGQELWAGLPPQALLTPYTELRAILAALAPGPGQTVVDLGAGYGRLGFVIARHYPGARFVGYELSPERVREGRARLDAMGAAPGVELQEADLAAPDFRPVAAEFYFIYDYGTRAAIAKTLEDLRAQAAARPLVVVGRGRATRDAIERGEPWLSQVVAPEHRGRFSVYRTRL